MYMYTNNKLQHSKINPTTLTAQREPLHRVADHARGQHQVRQGLDAIYVYIYFLCGRVCILGSGYGCSI